MKLADSIDDKDAFLRELHHRVKNNFQIIASLINLQKRMLPEDRRAEVRFVEEHVQSMAVAYRIVTTADGLVQVDLSDLVSEVVDGLRQIAGYGREVVNVSLPVDACAIRIEQAIALGLYLAVLVPAYLDSAASLGGTLRVGIALEENDGATLSLTTVGGATIPLDTLRQRLATAYLRQLRAELDNSGAPGLIQVRFSLQAPGSG